MAAKVNLQNLIDEMEMQFDGNMTFVNLQTGELVFILQEFLGKAEDGEDLDHRSPNWQQDEMKIAMDIVEHEDKYAEIPGEFEIHEYSMMENFCLKVEDSRESDILLNAIRGEGAFRRFKDKVADIGLRDEWFTYRDKCYRKIAIDFCEQYNLDYE